MTVQRHNNFYQTRSLFSIFAPMLSTRVFYWEMGMYDKIELLTFVTDLEDMDGEAEALTFTVSNDNGFYLMIDRSERESYGGHPQVPAFNLLLSANETKQLSDFLVFALSANK